MPFKSKSQRRKFYAMAERGEIPDSTVKEWEHATPKGKKLPEKVKKAFQKGAADALLVFGFRKEAEELRLKLKSRQYHGRKKAFKEAMEETDGTAAMEDTADSLASVFEQLDNPDDTKNKNITTRDPLDRSTAWGAPSNLSAGDTANRLSDMGQPTNIGTAF